MSLELSTPSTEGPRFDLRFERGRVQLRLGRPLVLDGLELEHLVVALDFRGPVDLRGGARRFRHHRGRVVRLRARVRPTKLATSAAEAHRCGSTMPTRRDCGSRVPRRGRGALVGRRAGVRRRRSGVAAP
ncbi:MAG: hypothetical protein R3B99_07145 [Polyangiales bacterium]